MTLSMKNIKKYLSLPPFDVAPRCATCLVQVTAAVGSPGAQQTSVAGRPRRTALTPPAGSVTTRSAGPVREKQLNEPRSRAHV